MERGMYFRLHRNWGPAALTAESEKNTRAWSELGARIEASIGSQVKTNFEMAWKHLYGRINQEKMMALQAGALSFPIRGVNPNRNEVIIGASIGVKASENLTLSLKYEGAYGTNFRVHSWSANAIFSW
jgi:uncharacterized protein with beta-barrel porin domain